MSRQHNQEPPSAPDSVASYTDSAGRHWTVQAEFKTFNMRMGIAAISVKSDTLAHPVTRRLLNELPLEDLFRDDLTAESAALAQFMQNRQSTTAHRGRSHSDDELRLVANIYLAALNAREPVQQTVAAALGISVSTAAKRIMAARRRGFIPSAGGDK